MDLVEGILLHYCGFPTLGVHLKAVSCHGLSDIRLTSTEWESPQGLCWVDVSGPAACVCAIAERDISMAVSELSSFSTISMG